MNDSIATWIILFFGCIFGLYKLIIVIDKDLTNKKIEQEDYWFHYNYMRGKRK